MKSSNMKMVRQRTKDDLLDEIRDLEDDAARLRHEVEAFDDDAGDSGPLRSALEQIAALVPSNPYARVDGDWETIAREASRIAQGVL